MSRQDASAELAGIREALARLAAVAQQPAEPQSSVEISRNAKGAAQWVVKAYHTDPAEAAARAQALYDELAERFGQGSQLSEVAA